MGNLKNYVIKKLGGYTAKEYDTVKRIPIQSAIPVETRNVEHLRTVIEVKHPCYLGDPSLSPEFVRDKLTRQLIPMVKERMKIRQMIDPPYKFTDKLFFEASIDIVMED